MALINIDGVDLPAPSDYEIPDHDLDSEDSNRNELGIMQRDRVRADIKTIPLKWNGIRSPEVALIKSAIRPSEFKVIFITEIGKIPKTMYAGNRNQKMVKNSDNVDEIRWDFSVNLIEV